MRRDSPCSFLSMPRCIFVGIAGWGQDLLFGQDTGNLVGSLALGAEPEDALDNRGSLLVENDVLTVGRTLFVAVGWSAT